MKKLLIATTALVGTASIAAADVTFSGYGRWGVIYEKDRSRTTVTNTATVPVGTTTVPVEDTRLESRFRLNIDGSTTTDGGVRFAARIRLEANDNDSGGVQTAGLSGARFQAGYGGLRVRVGNVSGVHDAATVIDFFGYEPGLIGQIGHYSTFGARFVDAFGSRGSGANGVNVLYEAGPFAVMGSWSANLSKNQNSLEADDFEAAEIGASYTFSGWTIGAAYAQAKFGDAGSNTIPSLQGVKDKYLSATLSGSVGIADLAFFVGRAEQGACNNALCAGQTKTKDTAYGLSGSVPVGAATNIVGAVAGGGADALKTAYGLGFTHSLGGGVTVSGMIGRNEFDQNVGDLGVRFNF